MASYKIVKYYEERLEQCSGDAAKCDEIMEEVKNDKRLDRYDRRSINKTYLAYKDFKISENIKITAMADEHMEFLYDRYCTYAWFKVPQFEEAIPIAVIDGKLYKKYNLKYNLLIEPTWPFISKTRTEEQQRFIENNIEELNDHMVAYLKANGYYR